MAPALAIVGAGEWACAMHLPAACAVQESGLARYVAVCDLDAAKAGALAGPLHAATFTDLDEMLARVRPDGLVLLVSTDAMPDVILRAAGVSIPFLCEKPPAPDSATHSRLIDAVGTLPHIVGYNRRHAPYVARAKEWLAAAAPQAVTALLSRHRRLDPDFSTTAVHAIDTVLYLAGGSPGEVRAEAVRTDSVVNYFISGRAGRGTRIDIIITPNAASAEEHYIVRSAGCDVVIAFPHRSVMDTPGFVERREGNRVVEHLTAADFGLAATDAPALSGIRAEHELFVRVLAGAAEAVSTLRTSYETQLVREKLVAAREAIRGAGTST